MSVYSCFPCSATLTCWFQAANLLDLHNSRNARDNVDGATLSTHDRDNVDDASLSTNAKNSVDGLGVHVSQLLLIGDEWDTRIHQLPLSMNDDITSTYNLTSTMTSRPNDPVSGLTCDKLLQLHANCQQQQRQPEHYHLHPVSISPPCSAGRATLPDVVCGTEVSTSAANTSAHSDSPRWAMENKNSLKFGINRILSADFGKNRIQKDEYLLRENQEETSSMQQPGWSLPSRIFSVPAGLIYTRTVTAYSNSSLPPVHDLYPSGDGYFCRWEEDMPGPYFIINSQPKRKKSWSRAVFSNLQRKGLEKRFEVQKYVTKSDRRQLATMLGLTDAQVKVWFQNRRMKWRHAQQQEVKDKRIEKPEGQCGSECTKHNSISTASTVPAQLQNVSVSEASADQLGEMLSVVEGINR